MLSRTLRPMTARAASLAAPMRSNMFLGPVCIRTFTNTTEAIADTTTTTEPDTTTTDAESEPRQQLPYFVGRNTLNNLSVYERKKRGGNLLLTLLKHGEGDLQALRRDIKDALGLRDEEIFINNVTKHVTIKGHKRLEVLNFLHTIGF